MTPNYGKATCEVDATRKYLSALAKYERREKAWNVRHPDGSCRLSDLPPCPPTRVYVSRDGVFLTVYNGGVYPIYWEQRNIAGTWQNLVWWVHHLSHKTWSDGPLIADFIDAFCGHYKLDWRKEGEI